MKKELFSLVSVGLCSIMLLCGFEMPPNVEEPPPQPVYTQEELTDKAHNYELEESPYTVFCVDYRQSGIGSNSCGPVLLEKYQLNEEEFRFAVRLKPERL